MDIQVNENVIEKVKIRDIILSIKDFFARDNSAENEDEIEKKLQEIYKAEKELGATDSIEKLTKELEMKETPKKKRQERKLKEVTINTVKEEKDSINNEKVQDETKEL